MRFCGVNKYMPLMRTVIMLPLVLPDLLLNQYAEVWLLSARQCCVAGQLITQDKAVLLAIPTSHS